MRSVFSRVRDVTLNDGRYGHWLAKSSSGVDGIMPWLCIGYVLHRYYRNETDRPNIGYKVVREVLIVLCIVLMPGSKVGRGNFACTRVRVALAKFEMSRL
jgi:hypothetical protein